MRVAVLLVLCVAVASAFPHLQGKQRLRGALVETDADVDSLFTKGTMSVRRSPDEWAPAVADAVCRKTKIAPAKTRFFHAKAHGCFSGTLSVFTEATGKCQPGEPDGCTPYSVAVAGGEGLFATPGAVKPAAVRFSSGQGSVNPDSAKDLRGFALMVYANLPLPRNLPNDPSKQQQWIGATGESFFIKNYEDTAKLVVNLAGLNEAQIKKSSASLWGSGLALAGDATWAFIKSMGRLAVNVFGAIKNGDMTNSGSGTYHSQLPYRMGSKEVMHMWAPCPGVKLENSAPASDPNVIKLNNLAQVKKGNGFCFNMYAKERAPGDELDTDKPWTGTKWVKLAQLKLAQAVDDATCEGLTVNPWRGYVAHQPLGNTQALRKNVYLGAYACRKPAQNVCPFTEGRVAEMLGKVSTC